MSDIEDMVSKLADGDNVGAKVSFSSAMADKVTDALEQETAAIASRLYAGAEASQEPEDADFDDETDDEIDDEDV